MQNAITVDFHALVAFLHDLERHGRGRTWL